MTNFMPERAGRPITAREITRALNAMVARNGGKPISLEGVPSRVVRQDEQARSGEE
jgi:hypothetical protein